MSTIIGQYDGKCADADVVNANGMEIGRDVWETLFASDEYKTALKRGHYIGFLGHPEDPGCQEFQNACIILRECHLEDNGEVFGQFDLIDTPVGKIVKAFIDAGVEFGISVRGAGDVVGGVVDAETFVFRGFDLVAFPAYSDAVPKFTEIAASSDIESQKKYKKICAAVNNNICDIKSSNSLDTIQSMFSSKSDVYKRIQSQKNKINASVADLNLQKIEATTRLYVDALQKIEGLKEENNKLREDLHASQKVAASYKRKLDSMDRITASQLNQFKAKAEEYRAEATRYIKSSESLQKRLDSLKDTQGKNKTDLSELQHKYNALVSANTKLKDENQSLCDSNLNYKQKINSSNDEIKNKNSIIASLKDELRQTVTAAKSTEKNVSNRDSEMKELKRDLKSAIKLVEQYQDAFASLYASALGVRVDSISITSSTTVDELKQLIDGGTSTCNIAAVPDTDIDQIVDTDNDDNLIVV